MNMLVPLKYEYTPMQPHDSSSATMAWLNADPTPPPPCSAGIASVSIPTSKADFNTSSGCSRS